jgi:hypothetical protein
MSKYWQIEIGVEISWLLFCPLVLKNSASGSTMSALFPAAAYALMEHEHARGSSKVLPIPVSFATSTRKIYAIA